MQHQSMTVYFCNADYLYVSCADLYDYNMELVETLLTDPYSVLSVMDEALNRAQHSLLEDFTISQQQYMVVKIYLLIC